MEKTKELLQIASSIEGISSRVDGTWKLVIGTQELNEEQTKAIIQLNRKQGWFLFKENQLVGTDLIDIPEIKPEFKTDKSPSQRLRGVLYVLFEQKYKSQYKTFEEFYRIQMEKIIDWIKEKLN